MHRIKLQSKARHQRTLLTAIKLVCVLLVLTLAAVRTSNLYVSTSTPLETKGKYMPPHSFGTDHESVRIQQQQNTHDDSKPQERAALLRVSEITNASQSNGINVSESDDTRKDDNTQAFEKDSTQADSNNATSRVRPGLSKETQDNSLPACGHVLVFTGPRHGSTWFLNNVENCTYSNSDGTFGKLHDYSELWVPRPFSNVMNMSVADAQDWIVHNVSLKIFPWPWRNRPEDAKQILLHAVKHGIPIVLLERDVYQAYRSIMLALRTKRWDDNARRTGNGVDTALSDKEDLNKVDEMVDEMVKSGNRNWIQFKEDMDTHLEAVSEFLMQQHLSYDRVNYDDIVDIPSITLTNAQCVIRNCNFANK